MTNWENTHRDVSLKEHIESRLKSLEKETSLAAANMERRLEGMNEFRAQLKDQASTFIGKSEFESKIKDILMDIRELRESRAELRGKASQKSLNLVTAIAIISIITSVIAILV